MIKERYGMKLTEVEDIKKRQKTQKRYTKKGIKDLDNYDGGGHSPRVRHP